MPVVLIVTIILVLIAFGIVFLVTYSKLLKLNTLVNNSWTEISFQLKRRSELIPKLNDIIKKKTKNQNNLVETFADVEKKMIGSRTISTTMEADKEFTEAFSYLIMISESNPKLKNDTAFQRLMSDFLDVEEKLQIARRSYNIYAEKNNEKLSSFPSNFINSFIGHFQIRKYYELEKSKARKKK